MKKRKSRQKGKNLCRTCGYEYDLAFCKSDKAHYCSIHRHNLADCCVTLTKKRICAVCRTKKVVTLCTKNDAYLCATDFHYMPCCAHPLSKRFTVCRRCKGLKAVSGKARRYHEKDICSWQRKNNLADEEHEPQAKKLEPLCFAFLNSSSRHHGARYLCRHTKFLYCRVHRHKEGCCEKLLADEIGPDLFHCSLGGTCVPVQYACKRYSALYCSAHACRIVRDGEDESTCCINIFTGQPINEKAEGILCYQGSAGGPELRHYGATYKCDRFTSTVFYCKKHKDHDSCCRPIPEYQMAWAARKSNCDFGMRDRDESWDGDQTTPKSSDREKLPEVTFANEA